MENFSTPFRFVIKVVFRHPRFYTVLYVAALTLVRSQIVFIYIRPIAHKIRNNSSLVVGGLCCDIGGDIQFELFNLAKI